MPETMPDYPDDAPDQLYVMRLVSIGNVPDSPYGRYLDGWFKAKPMAFVEKLTELEIAYWSGKKWSQGGSAPVVWDRVGECPSCGRPEGKVYVPVTSEAALTACREWLEKNAPKP